MLAYGWAYWVVIIVSIVFLILGGQLNLVTWMVTLSPSASFPFSWLIIIIIVNVIIVTVLIWLGVPMRSLFLCGTTRSHYNPFRRRAKKPRDDEEAN